MIVVLAAGVLALLLLAEEIPAQQVVLKSVIQSLAALVLTSGIVSVVANILVRHELTSFWLEAIGVRDAVTRAGLCDVGLDFHSYDFHTLIRQSSKIDILVIHAGSWFANRQNDFKDFLSHKHHELRVCLLDEGSEISALISKDFNYKDGDLSRKIGNTLDSLLSYIRDLEKDGQSTGWLRIWKHQRAPKHTYYRFDERHFLVPYNQAQGHPAIPVIGFESKGGGVADFLVGDFDRMLKDHAKLVYDSRSKTNAGGPPPSVAVTDPPGGTPEHAHLLS